MLVVKPEEAWDQFLHMVQERCGTAEFENWFAPIKAEIISDDSINLIVPNIFVQEYLLDNYKEDLRAFFPEGMKIGFQIKEEVKKIEPKPKPAPSATAKNDEIKLNRLYTFSNFIEGPTNQFVKSAALGVASHPGRSYNPLFIHGGVGLGKTHLLHSIGHSVLAEQKKLRVHCITTEGFINDLVEHLKSKSVDKLKRFYRTLDVLLVDDIQFLQNRLNFEEEFCNTFETLINQGKQIVITSDKPPGHLKLSQRLIARMEWGLVAHITPPDLETRVAILQHKAEQKGVPLPPRVAFFIAEHIFQNVRQLEGAINRLSAYCRMMQLDPTEEVVQKSLSELFEKPSQSKVTVERILKSVSSLYDVKVSDLRGSSRVKSIAFPRQIAMYLAKELMSDSLMQLASGFGGKTHSTLLHAWKKVAQEVEKDEALKRQIQLTKQNLMETEN